MNRLAKRENISMSVIRRLPRYYRFLGELQQGGTTRISSRELSERMGLTASQIRQDLNCFGDFGQQGYGYNVTLLRNEIAAILGIDHSLRTVVIGAGNLGRAVALYMAFETKGLDCIGIFDKKETITGKIVCGMPVRHIDGLDEFCRENLPCVAVLCVPVDAAREVVPQLVSLGIRSFLNFSHYDIAVDYPDCTVENVHLGDSMMTLCYRANQREASASPASGEKRSGV